MKGRIIIIALLAVFAATAATPPRRRVSPVETSATQTVAINETANDTSRINAKRRAAADKHYVNKNGFTVYVDSITGDEWIDSTAQMHIPKMEFPLWHAMSVGLNVWDPLMRAFGQHYGLAEAWVELSLHNRYRPRFEVGLGMASNKPKDGNFTYRTPVSVYFRIGADYNFLFNSNPDYSFSAGLRYGFSPFSYTTENVTIDSPYWGEQAKFNIPRQRTTAGWVEIVAGLRVKLWGPISAGWAFHFKAALKHGNMKYGNPWYIPGYGSRNSNIGASFSIVYTIPLNHLNKKAAADVDIETSAEGSETLPAEQHVENQ